METLTLLFGEWNLGGLLVGASTFLIIGLFHPLVIKAEYYFGVKSWWAFLLLGVVMCGVSISMENPVVSILAGVVAFSSFWSILEVFQQRERVRKGWFPANPKRERLTPLNK